MSYDIIYTLGGALFCSASFFYAGFQKGYNVATDIWMTRLEEAGFFHDAFDLEDDEEIDPEDPDVNEEGYIEC